MKILNSDQNSDQWFDDRLGKITGSKLGGIVVKRGTERKLGFYELIAEKLATKEDYQDAMERGHELEPVAVKLFSEKTGKQVESVGLCISDFNDDIALSPDGLIMIGSRYKEAVEVKCLRSAKHLQAYFEQKVPAEYEEQTIQYFIVNEDLETLFVTFYDPRISVIPIHWIELKREDLKEKIKFYREYQEQTLAEVNDLISKIAF
jgi:putative phage-type endonuclease